jgi:ribonuclease HII
MILGVDEAGRGPALGPLVVAGLACPSQDVLLRLGVKDSKQLIPAKREMLFSQLSGICPHFILEVPAGSIDTARERMTMNRLEVLCFTTVIVSMATGRLVLHPDLNIDVGSDSRFIPVSPRKMILDAADVKEERFGGDIMEEVSKWIDSGDIELLSRHKADRDHPVVGAASILAKVTRDRRIEEFRAQVGEEIGSGYSSDVRTREFLEGWVRRNGALPGFARASWDTCRRLVRSRSQSTLFDF